MEMKSFSLGFAIATAALLMVGGAIAAVSSNGGTTTFTYSVADAKAADVAQCFAEERHPGKYQQYLQDTYSGSDNNCHPDTWNYEACNTAVRQGKYLDKAIFTYVKNEYDACKAEQARAAATWDSSLEEQ